MLKKSHARLTVDEACLLAGISRATLYRLLMCGGFPAPDWRVPRAIDGVPHSPRWAIETVAKWVARRDTAAAEAKKQHLARLAYLSGKK